MAPDPTAETALKPDFAIAGLTTKYITIKLFSYLKITRWNSKV